MMTSEQKQILRDMQWIPEEKQDTCETCGAEIENGIPQYDPKTSQRLKCTNFHIKEVMEKIKKIKEKRS